MRKLPTRKEILERAEARFMGRLGSLPAITPEEVELKESGDYYEARRELMSGVRGVWSGEQKKYIDEMAREMGLRVVTKREAKRIERPSVKEIVEKHKRRWKKLLRKHRIATVSLSKGPPLIETMMKSLRPKKPKYRNHRSMEKAIAKVEIPTRKPKKKRKKRHVERAGKVPRSKKIRKRINNGQKVFSFPDHIWKVRKPRKKRRKHK